MLSVRVGGVCEVDGDDSMDAVTSSTGMIVEGDDTEDEDDDDLVNLGPSKTNMMVLLRGSVTWDNFDVNVVL